MSVTKMFIKFETLPNEILIECFEYFHIFDLLYSFGQLNHRFEQLLQTLPLHVNFEDISKKSYDDFCQGMFVNPDIQQRICSLRLSNRNTPGLITDFLLKFSLDQFSHLRSLTVLDIEKQNLQPLQELLRQLSQIIVLHLEESELCRPELERIIPIQFRPILGMGPNCNFLTTTLSIKSLTLMSLSLNEICRTLKYTPLLRYFKVSSVREEHFTVENHPSHLTHLNLGYFQPSFNDLTHFLQNMSNLRSLTIDFSNGQTTMDASDWEQLITSSLPYLNNFQFKLAFIRWLNEDNARRIFDRFQTDFWLHEHQWYTEYSVCTEFMMIYTIPYVPESRQIPLISKRYCNPVFDSCQTFRHVKMMVVSGEDVLKHGQYFFPNLGSLVFEEEYMNSLLYGDAMFASLMTLMNFSHLKHLQIPFDCQSPTPSLLFRILELSPQLISLGARPCFFQLLQNQSESDRNSLLGKIRQLDIRNAYDGHYCQGRASVRFLYRIVSNLEQLTMSLISVDDLFFLLNRFSKLSSFRVRVSPYERDYERFKIQALEQNALVHEERLERQFINLGVWIRRDTRVTKPDGDTKRRLSFLRHTFQRFMKKFEK